MAATVPADRMGSSRIGAWGAGLSFSSTLRFFLRVFGAGLHVPGGFADLPEGIVLIELNDQRAKTFRRAPDPKPWAEAPQAALPRTSKIAARTPHCAASSVRVCKHLIGNRAGHQAADGAQNVFQDRFPRRSAKARSAVSSAVARNLIPLMGKFLLGSLVKLLQFRQFMIEFLDLLGLSAKLQRQALAGLPNRIRKRKRLIFSQGRHLRATIHPAIMNQLTRNGNVEVQDSGSSARRVRHAPSKSRSQRLNVDFGMMAKWSDGPIIQWPYLPTCSNGQAVGSADSCGSRANG